MIIRKVKKGYKCEYPKCNRLATMICSDTKKNITLCCDDHALKTASNDSSEYIVDCPNCRCVFGVN